MKKDQTVDYMRIVADYEKKRNRKQKEPDSIRWFQFRFRRPVHVRESGSVGPGRRDPVLFVVLRMDNDCKIMIE